MGDFTLSSFALALARWSIWIATALVIGSAGARITLARARLDAPTQPMAVLLKSTQGIGVAGSRWLVVSCLLVLASQLYSWFGADGFGDADAVLTMVGETRWGGEWLLVTAAAMTCAVALAAVRSPGGRALVLPVAGIIVAATVPRLGHGAAYGLANAVAHSMHLFGVGLWLGTLFVLARALRTAWAGGSLDATAIRSLLTAFSPVALAGAGLVAMSGAVIAWTHVQPLEAAWSSGYGRTLVAKIVAVLIVMALGFRNWRSLVPALETPGTTNRLRVAIRWELLLSLGLVLLLTAWLGGLAVPASE